MANAHVLISSQTVSSAVNSISFNSIPGIYRDLILVVNGTTDVSTNPQLQFNGDTANLSYLRMGGNGTSIYSSTNTNAGYFGDVSAGDISMMIVNIFDYAQTDKHKTSLSRSAPATAQSSAWVTKWASTATITSMVVLSGISTNWSIGAKFYLYGVLA
jgi:hypothetical protein